MIKNNNFELPGLTTIQLDVENEPGMFENDSSFFIKSKRNLFLYGLYGIVDIRGENNENLRNFNVFSYTTIKFPYVSPSNMWTPNDKVLNSVVYDLMKPVYMFLGIHIPSMEDLVMSLFLHHDGTYPGVIHGLATILLNYDVDE